MLFLVHVNEIWKEKYNVHVYLSQQKINANTIIFIIKDVMPSLYMQDRGEE